ncbi:3'-5' exonuclease [Streptomyces flavidovirens]|uniref:3'-5' exonuclease n=1 Tax=Streptomyces flavidovirens TaxID=67298 RepID=UPI0036C4699E
MFNAWEELGDYATYDSSGHDLLALVEVIDEHGVEVILEAVQRLYPEDDAEVVVSTAHKAKGREWATVRIADDFEPKPGTETDDDGNPLPQRLAIPEARLAYVAVTRARQHLDLGGLSWINKHPDGNPGASPPPPTGPTRISSRRSNSLPGIASALSRARSKTHRHSRSGPRVTGPRARRDARRHPGGAFLRGQHHSSARWGTTFRQ